MEFLSEKFALKSPPGKNSDFYMGAGGSLEHVMETLDNESFYSKASAAKCVQAFGPLPRAEHHVRLDRTSPCQDSSGEWPRPARAAAARRAAAVQVGCARRGGSCGARGAGPGRPAGGVSAHADFRGEREHPDPGSDCAIGNGRCRGPGVSYPSPGSALGALNGRGEWRSQALGREERSAIAAPEGRSLRPVR